MSAPTASFWLLLAFALVAPARASDHADPIDVSRRARQEPGITDRFVFPVLADSTVAFPFNRTDRISLQAPDLGPRPSLDAHQREQIKGLTVILCVRRALTQRGDLQLEPYSYRINMDLHSTVSYVDPRVELATRDAATRSTQPASGGGYQPVRPPASTQKRPTPEEARARYGGLVDRPEGITADAVIELRLKNDASLNGRPSFKGFKNPDEIHAYAGVHDDPFIFPAFFGTNVVAMVLHIPMTCFPDGLQDWIVWATSHDGGRQIDHVGRSLRTQQPRFELLNDMPPALHSRALLQEHEDPGLLRDIALRFDLGSLFAYRAYDQVPDVMIYTTRYPVGFPNGRILTDDVAAMLAQHGDTMLLELSHHIGSWPRRTTNDKDFSATFPYLAEPWPDSPPRIAPGLTPRNQARLWGIGLGLVLVILLENWLFARWYCRRKLRPRYL